MSSRTTLRFLLASLISMAVWFQFTYPQLSLINLSVGRNQALAIATKYLQDERGVDLKNYRHATIFSSSDGADRYLQKSIGFQIMVFKEFDLFLESNRFL